MAFTTSSHLGLRKPAPGEESWGTEGAANYDALELAHCPKWSYFVSPDYVVNNSPTDRRHFTSIQAAITDIENNALSGRHTIFVWPGSYNEDLTITKEMSFVNVCGRSYIGSSPVALTGTGNASAITWNPPEGATGNVRFYGFRIESNDPGHGGTTRSAPLFVDITQQSSLPGTKNQMIFDGCVFRHSSNTHAADVYTYGIRCVGKTTLGFHNSTLIFPDDSTNDITYPIYVDGVHSAGNHAELQAENTLFHHPGFSTTKDTITVAQYVHGAFVRNRTNRASVSAFFNPSGGAEIDINGLLNDSEWTAYGNLFNCGDIMHLGT
jgi:hypothetical protein